MLRLKVARNAADIAELSSVWDALRGSEATLFQSFRWNQMAAQQFADRENPYFIFAEDDNGAAIIPAVIQLRSGSLNFAGEYLFDYRDYLAQGDNAVLTPAWQELLALDLPLSVTAICRDSGPIWGKVPKNFFSRAPRLESHAISAEDFVHQHSRAFSRLRKLLRIGLSITQYSGDSRIVRDIYERRAQQSEEGEVFRDRRRVEFMIAICREEGARCEVFALEHGSSLASAQVTFRDGDFRRFSTTEHGLGIHPACVCSLKFLAAAFKKGLVLIS